MQGIRARKQSAFDTLYTRHQHLLRRIVSQLLQIDADVEETVQDIFMEIWNRAANFDPTKGKALGWIICMARRRAMDRLRRSRRYTEITTMLVESADTNGSLAHSDSSEASGNDHLAARDRRRVLDSVIKFLPAEQQAVIRFSFFHQLSQRQIAAHTGIPLGTIKTRLELAISKLSKRLGPLREAF